MTSLEWWQLRRAYDDTASFLEDTSDKQWPGIRAMIAVCHSLLGTSLTAEQSVIEPVESGLVGSLIIIRPPSAEGPRESA